MTVDNQGSCYKIWLTRLGLTLVFALIILAFLMIPWFEREEAAVNKWVYVIITAAVYFLTSLYFNLQKHHYVYFSDDRDRIILRFYPLNTLKQRKSSIEIPKSQLVKYELHPFFFGLRHKLVLYHNFRNKVSRYPAVSLSTLSALEQKKILASLQEILSSR